MFIVTLSVPSLRLCSSLALALSGIVMQKAKSCEFSPVRAGSQMKATDRGALTWETLSGVKPTLPTGTELVKEATLSI